MAVAAVFAEDRRGLPEHQMRRVRPGQIAIGGGQRAGGRPGVLGGLAGQPGGFGELRGAQPPSVRAVSARSMASSRASSTLAGSATVQIRGRWRAIIRGLKV